uniref:Uncharacterized protein n=1 Tax=Vespula pensylvanica TaxID=30213 RepID=A0A834P051_VESPE|nr:hypothetical protein H0235_008521 [Vespula pensylvanica]
MVGHVVKDKERKREEKETRGDGRSADKTGTKGWHYPFMALARPRNENTITPLPAHNEFIAGDLRTINAELLMYCFISSTGGIQEHLETRLFSFLFF